MSMTAEILLNFSFCRVGRAGVVVGGNQSHFFIKQRRPLVPIYSNKTKDMIVKVKL